MKVALPALVCLAVATVFHDALVTSVVIVVTRVSSCRDAVCPLLAAAPMNEA